MIPGWSIVAAEKNIVDPSARNIAAAMPPMVGYAMFDVPVYIATELGPWRSTISDEPIGDLDDELLARDLLVRTVRPLPQAVEQALRARVDLGQGPPLRARVAAEQRSVAVAVHRDRPPVLDGHDDRAQRRAQPAEAGLRSGHAPPLRAVKHIIRREFSPRSRRPRGAVRAAVRILVLAVPSGISSRSAISRAVSPHTPASTTAGRCS